MEKCLSKSSLSIRKSICTRCLMSLYEPFLISIASSSSSPSAADSFHGLIMVFCQCRVERHFELVPKLGIKQYRLLLKTELVDAVVVEMVLTAIHSLALRRSGVVHIARVWRRSLTVKKWTRVKGLCLKALESKRNLIKS